MPNDFFSTFDPAGVIKDISALTVKKFELDQHAQQLNQQYQLHQGQLAEAKRKNDIGEVAQFMKSKLEAAQAQKAGMEAEKLKTEQSGIQELQSRAREDIAMPTEEGYKRLMAVDPSQMSQKELFTGDLVSKVRRDPSQLAQLEAGIFPQKAADIGLKLAQMNKPQATPGKYALLDKAVSGTPEEQAKAKAILKADEDRNIRMFGAKKEATDKLNAPLPLGDMATPEQALMGVPASEQNMIKKLANYELNVPSGRARTKQWEDRLQRAAIYDPAFSESEYKTRQAVRKSFTSGKDAINVTGINTAIGHIDSLVKAAKDLDNSDYAGINTITNILSKHLPVTKGLAERQGALTSAKAKFNAVAGEMASIFKASGATDQEIKAWKETIDDPTTATKQNWKSFIDGSIELMGSRLSALQDKYEKGMGKPKDFRMLNAKSQKILDKLGIDIEKIDPANDVTLPPGTPMEKVVETAKGMQKGGASVTLPKGMKLGW